jgi:hypothetical protein
LDTSVVQIANTLAETPPFQAIDPSLRQVTGMAMAKAFKAWLRIAPSATSGRIMPAPWHDFLALSTYSGLPSFLPDNPAFAYAKRVDMSYYDAANGKGSATG